MLDALFIFVTTTIPKAGAQIGVVPLTANLILLGVIVLRSPIAALRSLAIFRSVGFWYGILVVFGLVSTVAYADGGSTYSLAQRLVVVGSPLAAVAAVRCPPRRAVQIVAVAAVVTAAYALVQFVGGISGTSVQGITVTFGQSLETKTIGYTGEGDTAAKIPSTYQVGNSFGIFAALAVMLMLIWRPDTRRMRRLRVIAIVSGIVGLLLCGSRSIVIPVVICLVFVIYQYLSTFSRSAQQWALVVIIAGCLSGALYVAFFQSDILTAFWSRNVVQTLNDPTAAGRTDQWSAIWAGIYDLNGWQLARLILIGQDPSWGLGGEGLPAFFVTFGLPATIGFYSGLVVLARRLWQERLTRPVALGVLCVVFAFTVDTTYFYPPNLMNVYLIAIIAKKIAAPHGNDASCTPSETDNLFGHAGAFPHRRVVAGRVSQ